MATQLRYVEFTEEQYGTIPASVLKNEQVFTIEAIFSTTSTKKNNTYYRWATIVGVEISGTYQDDFALCVNDGKLCFWAQSSRNTKPKNYLVTSNVTVNDGKRHKVAVVSNADGSIDLYCDSSNVAHTDSVEATIANTTIYIAYNGVQDYSHLSMKLYELRFWDVARSQSQLFANVASYTSGLRAWYIPTSSSYINDSSGWGNTATLVGSPYVMNGNVQLNLDTRLDIVNLPKGWLIGTVGKAEEIVKAIEYKFDSWGTPYTVPEDTNRIKTYFNYDNLPVTKSKTGYAFDRFEATTDNYMEYFMLNIPATKEVWIKFDIYFNDEGFVDVGDARTGRKGQTVAANENNLVGDNPEVSFNTIDKYNPARAIFAVILSGKIYSSDNITVEDIISYVDWSIPKNQLSTVLVHLRSDRTNGIVEAWWDGVRVQGGNSSNSRRLDYMFKGNVNRGVDFNDVYLRTKGLVSNVIVSNMRIGFDATVQELTLPLDVRYEIKPSIVELSLDVKIKTTKQVSLFLDVKQSIFAIILDVAINILAEVNFSPLNREEIFQSESQETITAKSLDNNEIEKNVTSEANTSGLQSLELNLIEQQITDQVSFVGVMAYDIMQYIGGQYFDYLYKLRIESRTQQGILFSYSCCSNLDEMLYTQIAYGVTTSETIDDDLNPQTSDDDDEDKTIEEEEQELLETGEYHKLSEHAESIANYFELTPVVQLGDFADFFSSYKEQDLWGRTYADVIREMFGWSTRIPHKMINVYIRDDKIFFVQRGFEANVIDISNTDHTVPVINQELVRTFWGSTSWSKTEIKEKKLGTRGIGGSSSDDNFPADYINNDNDDEDDNVWSAVGSVTTENSAGVSVTKYDYTSRGVLRGTTTTFTSNSDPTQNSTTIVRNSYNADGLLEAVQTETTHPDAPEEDKKTLVKYGYLTIGEGQKFLASEFTAEYEKNSDGNYELVNATATAKSPTGRGQGTSYDNKGKGTASGNVGDDRVTPYQLRTAFKTTEALSIQKLARKTTTTINGFTDIDPSFPLLLIRDRATVTEALKWLNRKTKETVTLSVYNFAHIIDLNDRIVLDGATYFLVSNNVKTASRLYNEQNLTLARWF